MGLREAVKPCLLDVEVNGPFKCLSIACFTDQTCKTLQKEYYFLPFYYLYFSQPTIYYSAPLNLAGHASPPVLFVSAPPHSAETGAREAALSSELLIWEIAGN